MRNEYCATIGFFDGVHRGHQFMIDSLTTMAHAQGRQSLVITFDRHPRQVVHADYVPQLITTTDEKLQLLHATAADRIEMLHFDAQMAQLSAYEFMRQVLHEKYGVAMLLTGYDNRFGHNRAEGFADYVRYGEEMGMKVLQNTPIDIDGMRVSSSLIRRLIVEGNITEASNCMGHPYSITGSVAHGFQEGRRIGFPTANIVPESAEKLVPGNGVYATRVSVEGGEWMPAMLNIGTNPTFQRQQTTIEAHIIGFEGDIYGRKVRVEFGRKLRDEQRFESVEALQKQLEADKKEVEMVRW
ncbi:bifunctional riboflavin kinase/FAD synthetase [Leyella stercorea]|uniref:bifunctional riboflavin kinase/FAD synthetase n=1 Tax=Leyella stercorea TaxID=363265 RepID=UPI00266CE6CB|nr:bifunctional riboflavin kinase/FAD synthetase [Leyella stercorea]